MTNLRRRLAGLAAVLMIAAIIIGLPVVLIALGANPLSGGAPSIDNITSALTSPDDGTLAITVIETIGWITWAILTLTLALEISTQTAHHLRRDSRQLRTPALPGLRVPQHLAHSIVGIAALLFIGISATGTAPPAAATPAATATAAPADQTTNSAVPAAAAVQETVPTAAPQGPAHAQTTVTHTVRRGETLWSIAAAKLGDGHRYREIVDLNPTLLTNGPTFIKAGWVLTIPAPADQPTRTEAAGQVQVVAGDTLSGIALEELGDADRYPEIARASRDITQPGGAHLTDPDVIDVGWTVKIPDQTTADPAPSTLHTPQQPIPRQGTDPSAGPRSGADPAPTIRRPAEEDTAGETATTDGPSSAAQEHLEEDSEWIARTSYGVGALLAAGAIALLAKRRGVLGRRRRPGQHPPPPDPRTLEVEHELRVTADPLAVETVDTVLRSLSRSCSEAETPLPVVRAARLTASQFDLYLVEPAQLPAPWTAATDDSTVWTIDTQTATQVDPATVQSTSSPYPALVTIGHDDEEGSVLLDLEQLGTLGVAGDDQATREVLAALSIELATSVWADDLQVTLVGGFSELEGTLQTGRIRYLPTVGHILENLQTRAAADRRALADSGMPDLQAARAAGAAPDAWTPEIVLLIGHLTDRHRTQIEQLVDELPRVALATITTAPAVGAWSLHLNTGDADQAVLDPIGLTVRPQRLPAEQYGHLLEMVLLADVDELEGEPLEEPTLDDLAPADSAYPDDSRPEMATSTAPDDHAAAVDDSEVLKTRSEAVKSLAHTASQDAEPSGELRGDAGTTAAASEEETPDPDANATSAMPPTRGHERAELGVDPVERDVPVADASAVDELGVTVDSDEIRPGDALGGDAGSTTADEDAAASVQSLTLPKLLVLGPVDLVNAGGKVEPTRRARLLELATYIALHPGASHTAIDDAVWPDRKTEDNTGTRNPATTKLRRWVGSDLDGLDYLPRHQAGGYAFRPEVSTDVADWDQLVDHDPASASTGDLESALALVRGIPFQGVHRRRYAFAEPLKQRLSREIVDTAFELARRRLMDGRWAAAEEATLIGLLIEPAHEPLWRLRILAVHEGKGAEAEAAVVEALLTITSRLGCDLEPETEQLLTDLKTPAPIGRLITDAL